MPEMYVHHSVVIHRDGKHIRLTPGMVHDFTDAEAKEILAANAESIRHPVNEGTRHGVARSQTDASVRGLPIPDADEAEDANVLAMAEAKAGGTARNQGGSIEEDQIGQGLGTTQQQIDRAGEPAKTRSAMSPTGVPSARRAAPTAPATKAGKPAPAPAHSDEDEL